MSELLLTKTMMALLRALPGPTETGARVFRTAGRGKTLGFGFGPEGHAVERLFHVAAERGWVEGPQGWWRRTERGDALLAEGEVVRPTHRGFNQGNLRDWFLSQVAEPPGPDAPEIANDFVRRPGA